MKANSLTFKDCTDSIGLHGFVHRKVLLKRITRIQTNLATLIFDSRIRSQKGVVKIRIGRIRTNPESRGSPDIFHHRNELLLLLCEYFVKPCETGYCVARPVNSAGMRHIVAPDFNPVNMRIVFIIECRWHGPYFNEQDQRFFNKSVLPFERNKFIL